jgi:hypothetical protein
MPAKAGIQYSLTFVFTGSPAYAGDDPGTYGGGSFQQLFLPHPRQ